MKVINCAVPEKMKIHGIASLFDKDTQKNWPKITRHTYLLHFWPPEDLLKSHQQGAQRHLQCLRLPSSEAEQGYSEEKRMILILLHS